MTMGRSAPRRQIPIGALNKAVRAIEAEVANLVTVGSGFKFSRGTRYGKKPKPCVKIIVVRKLARPLIPIPKRITILHRGVSYSVLTDVVVLRASPVGLPPSR
jgi:hypothetical protein